MNRSIEELRILAERQKINMADVAAKARQDQERLAIIDVLNDLNLWIRAIESHIKDGKTSIWINDRAWYRDSTRRYNWEGENRKLVPGLDSERIFRRSLHYRDIYLQELQKALGQTFRVGTHRHDVEIDDEGYRDDAYDVISVDWR